MSGPPGGLSRKYKRPSLGLVILRRSLEVQSKAFRNYFENVSRWLGSCISRGTNCLSDTLEPRSGCCVAGRRQALAYVETKFYFEVLFCGFGGTMRNLRRRTRFFWGLIVFLSFVPNVAAQLYSSMSEHSIESKTHSCALRKRYCCQASVAYTQTTRVVID